MSFTNPAVLWALPLGLVPLLMHLLSRRQARRVDFSDLTLLRRVAAQALPRTRLHQWLLAAARCAVLLCLLFAYAGPVLQARGGRAQAAAAGSPGLDLVLLLDRSYSMGLVEGGRTRWAVARAAADELLRSLRPTDRVACAAFSDRLEGSQGLAWMTPRACQELLDRSPPGFRGTDYAPALAAANAWLAQSRRDRAVLLLSDGAAHGLRADLPAAEPGVGLYCLDWPAPPDNATVLSAGPARESSPGHPLLHAVLWSTGRAESALDLWQGRQRLAGSAVRLRAAAETSADLPLSPAAAGAMPSWSGRVELRPDPLPADDACYFSFQQPRRPRLLVLYGDPGFLRPPRAGYFLAELFTGTGKRLLDWEADFAELDRFSFTLGPSGARLADYDAVALADFQSLPVEASAALELFVSRGGGLWLLAGSGEKPPDLSRQLPWLPLQARAVAPAQTRGLSVEKAAPFPGWKDFELDKLALTRRLGLAGGEVWLRDGGGAPLLASAGYGSGRVAVCAASLDAVSGNAPVKPVFVALVSAGLSLLREPMGPAESFSVKVGEPLVRTWGRREAAPASVRVLSPEGRATTLWVKDRRVDFAQTDRPGLYAMEDDAGGRRVFAVNLDRGSKESDPAPAASPPWRGLSAQNLREEFWLKAQGRDARPAALAAAAACLLAEMLLALPRTLLAALLLLAGLSASASAQSADRFVWTQVRLGRSWDPYPDVPGEVLQMLGTVTSVLVEPQRRITTLKDPALFESPLIILAGREAPPALDAEEVRRLRAYLEAGGMLWLEDTSGLGASSFDRWVRATLKDVLPESDLAPLPTDHVVFKTFFLLRGAAGRSMVRGTLEGVSGADRTSVIYSRNDLLGAWARDALGRPLLPCLPGGEAQRHNARKLTLDILMYALTGSYKDDAVHQPYLLQKLRQGAP